MLFLLTRDNRIFFELMIMLLMMMMMMIIPGNYLQRYQRLQQERLPGPDSPKVEQVRRDEVPQKRSEFRGWFCSSSRLMNKCGRPSIPSTGRWASHLYGAHFQGYSWQCMQGLHWMTLYDHRMCLTSR